MTAPPSSSSGPSLPFVGDAFEELHLIGVQLDGIKGFPAGRQHAIPLRPLTLVYGQNNSGKSTILKSLANFAQTLNQNRTTVQRADWWGQGTWFDFGSGPSLVHDEQGRKFSIAFDFKAVVGRKERKTEAHRLRYVFEVPKGSVEPRLHSLLHESGPDWRSLEPASDWVRQRAGRKKDRGLHGSSWQMKTGIRDGVRQDEAVFNLATDRDSRMAMVMSEVQESARRVEAVMDRIAERWASMDPKFPTIRESARRTRVRQFLMREVLGPLSEALETFDEESLEPAGAGPRADSSTFIRSVWEEALSPVAKSRIDFSDYRALLDDWSLHVLNDRLDDHAMGMNPPLVFPGRRRIFAVRTARVGRAEQIRRWINSETEKVLDLGDAVVQWMNMVEYQSAARLEPRRRYSRSNSDIRSVGVVGRVSLERLLDSPELLDTVNRSLDEIVNVQLHFAEWTSHRVGGPGRRGGRQHSDASQMFSVRVGRTGTTQSLELPDVGFGISQLIPLLVSVHLPGALIIEEPESNLHPRAQARVLEEMVRAVASELEELRSPPKHGSDRDRRTLSARRALQGPQCILETHSEHLLRRLLQLMERGDLADEDVSIIYVTNEGGRTVARRCETVGGRLVEPLHDDFSGPGNPTMSLI